ncbi:hypothetical protein FE633_41190 [Streptomyces montanus]|uniref:Uncharacterized protein n=1 Tax=Streptomyces montanus TaxID=2580423 RepID=A0A5R9F9X6_9ACTN|nr:hypothetical protein [Streptomyces montanus]TLS40507.1 hypothetical protein FE633_41190 [Streptomyces montanus]
MGTDIHGYVECRAWGPGLAPGESAWQSAISLSVLGTTRDYPAFDCLFGVRSWGRWEPIAADRGLPADAAARTVAELESWGGAAFGVTWLGWDEVLAIDWDEPALPRATDIARYRRLPDQRLELVHRSVWSRGFARASGVDTLTTDPGRISELWDEGTEWHVGNTVFRAERARRRDAVPPPAGGDGNHKDGDSSWEPVWSVMRTLAGVHGEQHVRLVVWFDE